MINIELISPQKTAAIVKSVNDKTGDVVLTAKDVNALPADTHIPSIEGLATVEYVNKKVLEAQAGDIDLSAYATIIYVDEKFNSIEIPEVDLSNHYTKAETDALIPDVSGFALKTDIPEAPDLEPYALKADIPDVTGYQTAEQVEAAITAALGEIGVAEDGEF